MTETSPIRVCFSRLLGAALRGKLTNDASPAQLSSDTTLPASINEVLLLVTNEIASQVQAQLEEHAPELSMPQRRDLALALRTIAEAMVRTPPNSEAILRASRRYLAADQPVAPSEVQQALFQHLLRTLDQQIKRALPLLMELETHKASNDVAAQLTGTARHLAPSGMFEHRYRLAAQRHFQTWEPLLLSPLPDPPSHDLDALFIEPAVHWRLPNRQRSGYKGQIGIDRLVPALSRVDNAVILGEPGSGKSTLLQWLGLHIASARLPGSLRHLARKLPFLVRVRQFVDSGFPQLSDLPLEIAPELKGQFPVHWVEQKLAEGSALIMIDGLDEIPDSVREQTRARLTELATRYPRARYLMTARESVLMGDGWEQWEQWFAAHNFAQLHLLPMDEQQTERFVDHWFLRMGRRPVEESSAPTQPEAKSRAAQLKRVFQSRPSIRHLASTPLLTGLLCSLVSVRGASLPSERTELYDSCLNLLLAGSHKGSPRTEKTAYLDLSYTQKLNLLAPLAYTMLTNEWVEVEEQTAEKLFDQYLSRIAVPAEVKGHQIRTFLVERTGVLVSPAPGRISFVHRTFQEYLAAWHVLNEDDLEPLLGNAVKDLWREVVVLVAGMARSRNVEQLFTFLLDTAARVAHLRRQYLLLALRCLGEAPMVPALLKERVLAVASTELPPRNKDEARQVAGGGEVLAPHLVARPGLDEEAAAACVYALTLIGTRQAREAIQTYQSDQRQAVVVELEEAERLFSREYGT